MIDRTGDVYGRLTVIKRAESAKRKDARWLCQCECGTAKIVVGGHLANGHTKSCGCLNKERTSETHTTHGHRSNGISREYNTWYNMKQRCTNLNAPNYDRYGGRGITICESWMKSFEQFLADMGSRPENTSIDRINVNGNYELSNCQWATPTEQANNRRRHHV